MRRFAPAVGLVLALLATPVSAVNLAFDPTDPTGLIASDNVELLTTLPQPGVFGGRFRDNLLYTTGLSGLVIYDVSTPAAPVVVGRLALPHFENEDVDLGGDILLVSNDAAESTGILYVVDISDPAAPVLAATHQMGGSPAGGPGHTASCVYECAFAVVTDSGGYRVIDLRVPTAPVNLGTLASTAAGSLGITHDIQLDGDGNMWAVGYGGTAGYALPSTPEAFAAMVTGELDGTPRLGDLLTDNRAIADSKYGAHFGTEDTEYNDYIHHNSYRAAQSPYVYVTEEDYTRPGCRGAGEFQVWQAPTVTDEETGEVSIVPGSQMTEVGDWTVELLADTAQPAVQCSAHYFDVREDGIVAQAWYQQGLRVLDVSDPTAPTQVAFYAPQSAMDWAAYFSPIDPSIVYVLDASHGIDVLRVNVAPGDPGLVAPIRPEWRTGTPADTDTDSRTFGAACRLLPLP